PSVFHLLGRTGEYFHGRATYSQAAPLLRDALANCEKTLGPEHRDTAGSLNKLANVLRAQGDLAGARPLFERALAICEKALGPEHYDTAESLNDLAVLLSNEGDFAGARLLLKRALAIGANHVKRSPLGETAFGAHDIALGRDHDLTKDSARVTADALDALGRT